MKKLLRKLFINNYRKNIQFILRFFRHDVLSVLSNSWFYNRLRQNFEDKVEELKHGNNKRFVYFLQGGGNSYQRRKQRRLIDRNIVSNFANYRD